jgi:lantibiotic modifying enzyme
MVSMGLMGVIVVLVQMSKRKAEEKVVRQVTLVVLEEP